MPDTTPVRWTPDRRLPVQGWPQPSLGAALWRGMRGLCPACGQSRLFTSFLGVRAVCPMCTAPLGRLRADDAPPYITIFIVGHVLIGSAVLLDRSTHLGVGTELAIFLPLALILCAALLRPAKGATVGLMLRLRMDGTDGGNGDPA